MTRLMAALMIGLVAAGGVAGYMYMKHTQFAARVGEGQEQGPKGQGPAGEPGGGPQGAPMGQGGAQGGMAGAGGECNSVGLNNETIGRNINWLLDNHYLFSYKLEVYPENKTIVWLVSSENKTALEVLVSHIMQMECVLESGGTPRPHDPLFVVDAEISSKYVHTEIEWVNDTTVKIVKTADNDCAFEVIKLHAEVVKGFFDTGRLEAQKTHEIPDYVAEVCAPYLNQTVEVASQP